MEGAEALYNVASKLKLNFSFDDKFNLLESHSYHSLFQLGNYTSKISNLIHGLYKGKILRCFDYHFYFNTRSGRDNHYYSCVLYDFDGKVRMKRLDIRPEGFFDKLVGAGGFGNINFESHEFSREFHVECADKKFAYDVIHPRMMELLLQNKTYYSFEINEHSILLYKNGKLDSQEAEYMLDTMVGFINLIPAYETLLPELKEEDNRYREDISRRIGTWLINVSIMVPVFVLFGLAKMKLFDPIREAGLILLITSIISILLFVAGRILRR